MTSPRKSGAQPHNKNALKHGIYSHFILLRDDAEMKGMSDENPKDDLAMARVNFVNAMKERIAAVDTKDKLSWDFASHYWMETIISLKFRPKETEQVKGTLFESLIDAFRAANDRQKVR